MLQSFCRLPCRVTLRYNIKLQTSEEGIDTWTTITNVYNWTPANVKVRRNLVSSRSAACQEDPAC